MRKTVSYDVWQILFQIVVVWRQGGEWLALLKPQQQQQQKQQHTQGGINVLLK